MFARFTSWFWASHVAHANFASPLAATDIAVRWDTLYDFLMWLSIFFFILIFGAMIYFAVAFRASKGQRPKYITGNHLLETIWIAIPTVLLMVIFAWGYAVYHSMTQAPSDAYEVKVLGQQWNWTFLYDNGRSEPTLYVPVNKPVKLIMSSKDVLHSFFIPNFRVKQDVVPGMYTSVWFEAKIPGRHHVYCAEYCGASHSGMLAWTIVLTDDQWAQFQRGVEFKWDQFPLMGVDLAAAGETGPLAPLPAMDAPIRTSSAAPMRPEVSLAQRGHQLYETKGCTACHSIDGENKIGPSFKGLWGKQVELTDGSYVKADENYIREAIERPQAKVVKGFQPVMPTFQGQFEEQDLSAMIAYIKTLGEPLSASGKD